jgi:UPF0755 protein
MDLYRWSLVEIIKFMVGNIKLSKILLYCAVFFSILLITSINIVTSYLYIPGPLKNRNVILLQRDLSINEISTLLAESNIIQHPKFFALISKIYSLYHSLKSGEYEFTYGISPIQVLRKLASGKSIIHRIIIQEGMSVNEIINIVNNEKLLDGTISTQIPEGYLMPSTYFYSYGDKRENIIDKMRLEMSLALDEVMQKLPKSSPLKSRKDVLILASIIAKETSNDDERAKIAAVFINRLKKQMKLQACPTVIYALTQGKYKLGRTLTKTDLKTPSPYNTYYNFGLPVGAISCPSKKTLEATVNPTKTDDLYFVTNGNSRNNFSKTFEEHNQNIENIKQSLKQGNDDD